MLAIENRPVKIGDGHGKPLVSPGRKRNPSGRFYLLRIGATTLLAVTIASLAPNSAHAGPFKNFFRKVRHAFNEPARHSSSHRVSQKTRPDEREVQNAPATTVNGPPNDHNIRSARRGTASHTGKINLPYGTPVPGRQGFVTSPFAPDSGYVDVRGVPPGTEVKDPYSGKSFLAP